MNVVDLTELDQESIARGLRNFYQAAYSTPSHTYTDEDMNEFETRFARHTQFDNFRIIGIHSGEKVVAFAYGFTFPDGRWWNGSITPEPEQVKGKSLFGLIELAVSEPFRGRGLARTLHDALLTTRTEDFATLLSRPDSASHPIYPRWGWNEAGQAQSFPGWPIDDVFLMKLPYKGARQTDYKIRVLDKPPLYAQN